MQKTNPWESFNQTTSIDKDGWNRKFHQTNVRIDGCNFVNTCYGVRFGFMIKDVTYI